MKKILLSELFDSEVISPTTVIEVVTEDLVHVGEKGNCLNVKDFINSYFNTALNHQVTRILPVGEELLISISATPVISEEEGEEHKKKTSSDFTVLKIYFDTINYDEIIVSKEDCEKTIELIETASAKWTLSDNPEEEFGYDSLYEYVYGLLEDIDYSSSTETVVI